MHLRMVMQRSSPHSLLVARSADAAEFNAQAKNAQNILRFWSSATVRPEIYAFREADERVAENPNVRINAIRRGRLEWRYDYLKNYLKPVDAIFYPGMHYWLDYAALRAREIVGRRVPIIGTIEGLIGDETSHDRETYYSALVGHDVYCQRVHPRLCRRIEAIAGMADELIAISPFLARMATARYGAKVSMIPLGVDPVFLSTERNRKRDRPRVVGAGSLTPRKRPELFLKLARRFPGVDFIWFGRGELHEALVREIRTESLVNLAFPGGKAPQDLAREFAGSDVLVLPSLAEGVPKVTQEAAAAGLAQIVFGFYEPPSVVESQNGFVVWSDEELEARLDQLLSDRDLTANMGATGRNMAQEWTWQHVAPLWERKIIDVIERVRFAKLKSVDIKQPSSICDCGEVARNSPCT